MIQRISILGVGLLGGSIGLAVKRHLSGCRVTGYGRSQAALGAAVEAGAIDAGTTDLAAAVAGAELVVICTPVKRIVQTLDELAGRWPAGCVVTDVGSTKASIVRAGEQATADFVGSHPMAGSEKSGVAAARADLFAGATCVMTPTPRTTPRAARLTGELWTTLGCRVVRTSPAEHDRRMALVSHLPHAVAAALVRVQSADSRALAGPGYRDTTRIAAGDPALWREILTDNAADVIAALTAFESEIAGLKQALAADDAAAVEAFLARAAQNERPLREED